MLSNGSRLSLVFGRSFGRVIVEVNGPLDARTAGQLRHRLTDLIDGQGNRHLVLDLRGTTLVDGAGLSVLVYAHRRVEMNAGQLVMSGASPEVRRVLEEAGLDKVFSLTPSWMHPVHGDGPSESAGSTGLGA